MNCCKISLSSIFLPLNVLKKDFEYVSNLERIKKSKWNNLSPGIEIKKSLAKLYITFLIKKGADKFIGGIHLQPQKLYDFAERKLMLNLTILTL